MRDFVLEKQIVAQVTKKCKTNDAAFLELFLLNCIFAKTLLVLLAGLFSKQIMYCLFAHFL